MDTLAQYLLRETQQSRTKHPYPIFGDEGDARAGHPSLSPADLVARGPRPRPVPRRARTRDAERGTVDESLLKAPVQRNCHAQDQHHLSLDEFCEFLHQHKALSQHSLLNVRENLLPSATAPLR